MGHTDKSAGIVKAIPAMESGEIKDYSEAARRFEVNDTTISRRIKGIKHSREEAGSLYRQCLTSTQEKVLVKQIKRLTDCMVLPTSQIVKNLGEEIRGKEVGKN
jgi:predicted site-specific integrase-resolvase